MWMIRDCPTAMVEVVAKGLQAMRIMFQHLGANILAREILTTYEKPLNEESAISMINSLVKLSKA
jgi:hypothetical protein